MSHFVITVSTLLLVVALTARAQSTNVTSARADSANEVTPLTLPARAETTNVRSARAESTNVRSARAESTNDVTQRTIFAGLLTVDQLNAIIATPGAGTFLFLGLLAWGFLISFIIGYFELMVGLPGYGTSRNLGAQTFTTATLLSKLSTWHEVWPLLNVIDDQCRKRLLCELHTVGPQLGSTARKVIWVMDYVGHANVSSAPQWLRPVLEEVEESMRMARGSKGCSIYHRCAIYKLDPDKAPTVTSKSKLK